MLVIRKEQIEKLNEARMRGFEDEMVAHLAEFSPPLFKVIKEDQMREAVRLGLRKAEDYGLTLRGPIRLYLEMMLLFGSHFDTDPQYPWAAEILSDRHTVSEMDRADRLFAKIADYQEKVSGPRGANTRKALENLAAFGRTNATFSSTEYVSSIRHEMTQAFPQKAEYIGKKEMTALIREARSEAKRFGLPKIDGETPMIVLMYAFGHGCADDPLYPWIGRTLRDEKITSPEARTERLRKKAMTWLDHVLKGNLEEAEL